MFYYDQLYFLRLYYALKRVHNYIEIYVNIYLFIYLFNLHLCDLLMPFSQI